MTSFMNQRYRAERVFIAAAGKVDHDSLRGAMRTAVRRYPGQWQGRCDKSAQGRIRWC